MYRFETYGERVPIDISKSTLGWQYIQGKANRDFWFKEKGWWDKHSVYIPEEFLTHLMPLCFIEMFSRAPRVHLVRYVFDNFYTDEEFERDTSRCWNGYETVPGGVEFLRNVN